MTTLDERYPGIALPGDPAFDAATRVFNLSAPARPAASVTARTVEDIRTAIRYAGAHGIGVRVLSTGHASAAVRPVRHAVLIRTELAGGVDVDTSRRVARVPAGAPWQAVVDAATPHGLAAPHGSAATVGVVGFLLRGGISFYSRKIGLAVNSVRAIELVTADGELSRVDATHDPDLFWSLRGGGGGFGVVTAVEIDLFPATSVITGTTIWPARHAPGLLAAWRRWTVDAPREVSTSLRLMNVPPLPDVPPVLSAGPVLAIDGVVVDALQEHADDLLGPLRAVAEPLLDTWAPTTPSAVLETHMDPADPVAFLGDHMLLNELDSDGEAAFLDVLGPGSGTPLVVAGLRQLGGAIASPDPDGGALNHLPARYAYSGSGVPGFPGATVATVTKHCARVRAALRPWDTGGTAPTFVESHDQPQRHLDPDQVTRLDQVRARVDPNGVFRGDIAPNSSAAWR
jgi:FAD binding domain-containing protein